MGVPTLEEFQQLHDLLKNSDRPVLVAQAAILVSAFKKSQKLDVSAISDFVKKEHELLDFEWEAVRSTPAMQWLSVQPGYVKAMASVRRNRKNADLTPESRAFQIAQRALPPLWTEYVRKLPQHLRSESEAEIRKRFDDRSSVEGQARSLANQLVSPSLWRMGAGMVGALRDYHYLYRHRIEREKLLPDLLDKAYKLFSESASVAESLEAVCEDLNIYARTGHRFLSMKAAGIEALRTKVSSRQHIKRFDKTARERLLVGALAETFWSTFQAYKPAAIADLLTIEGIENQLDQRTIERILSGLKDRKARQLAA